MSKKKSIAIDMDAEIADTVLQFIKWYDKEYKVLLEKTDFDGKPESETIPDGAIRKFLYSKKNNSNCACYGWSY